MPGRVDAGAAGLSQVLQLFGVACGEEVGQGAEGISRWTDAVVKRRNDQI